LARILVIDDENLVRMTLKAVLSAGGHQVALAANGKEGLAQFLGAEFDLNITDLIMPEMEGIETIRVMRQRSKQLRILAISGGGRNQIGDFLDMALRLGADATLRKPFTNDELLRAVDRAISSGNGSQNRG